MRMMQSIKLAKVKLCACRKPLSAHRYQQKQLWLLINCILSPLFSLLSYRYSNNVSSYSGIVSVFSVSKPDASLNRNELHCCYAVRAITNRWFERHFVCFCVCRISSFWIMTGNLGKWRQFLFFFRVVILKKQNDDERRKWVIKCIQIHVKLHRKNKEIWKYIKYKLAVKINF